MTRVMFVRSRPVAVACVGVGMKELNEMTIGRTDDPENPLAFEAAGLFGAGTRNPSGPAVMMPRQQAGHMIAVDPPVRILIETLEPKGPPTHDSERTRSWN